MNRKKRTTLAEDMGTPDGRAEMMRSVRQTAADILTPGQPIPEITLASAAYSDPIVNDAILLLHDIVKSLDASRRAEGMQALTVLNDRLRLALRKKFETDIITRRRVFRGAQARRAASESESQRVLKAVTAGRDPAKSDRQIRRIKARAKK
jgi:hypothetical protein